MWRIKHLFYNLQKYLSPDHFVCAKSEIYDEKKTDRETEGEDQPDVGEK